MSGEQEKEGVFAEEQKLMPPMVEARGIGIRIPMTPAMESSLVESITKLCDKMIRERVFQLLKLRLLSTEVVLTYLITVVSVIMGLVFFTLNETSLGLALIFPAVSGLIGLCILLYSKRWK